MKALIGITILLNTTIAWSLPCDEDGALQRLSALNGRRQIGDCHLEVHICDQLTSLGALDDDFRFWMGDILVRHKNGKSLYMGVFSPQGPFMNGLLSLKEKKNSVNYIYQDKNHDPESGRRERYELTFSKDLKRLTFSRDTSVEARQRPLHTLFFHDLKIVCESTQQPKETP